MTAGTEWLKAPRAPDASSGFFEGHGKLSKKPSLVDVGGKGNCGFKSIAAAFLDNCLTNRQVKPALISKFLEYYFQTFPKHEKLLDEKLLTPLEKLKKLVAIIDYDALITNFARFIRILVVQEIRQDPVRYQGAFIAQNEGTSPERLLEETTWIDETAIAAAAHVLHLWISVKVIRRDSDIPLIIDYNEPPITQAKTAPKVAIQLKNNHYQPYLTITDLKSNRKLAETPPLVITPPVEPVSTEISKLIAEHDAKLVDQFEVMKKQLRNWITNNLLSKEDLLNIYIKNMQKSDYLNGRVKYVGVEHGNQDFFEKAIYEAQGQANIAKPFTVNSASQRPIDSPTQYTKDEIIITELIHALARAISIGHLEEKEILSVITKNEDKLPSHGKQNSTLRHFTPNRMNENTSNHHSHALTDNYELSLEI